MEKTWIYDRPEIMNETREILDYYATLINTDTEGVLGGSIEELFTDDDYVKYEMYVFANKNVKRAYKILDVRIPIEPPYFITWVFKTKRSTKRGIANNLSEFKETLVERIKDVDTRHLLLHITTLNRVTT